jgi:cold shock CspA family protein
MRREGVVWIYYPDKQFGFIEQSVSPNSPRLHFHLNAIQRDWRGSVSHATIGGAPVTFVKRTDRPDGRVDADDVRGVFIEERSTIPLSEHREVSKIHKWNGRFGELIREDGGDPLFFHKDSIVQQHRISEISVGDFVYHGVDTKGVDRRNRPNWVADNVQLYSRTEQSRLQQGLNAYDIEAEPIEDATVVETPLELLTPENRKKTLWEIIQERRNDKA